MDLVRKTSKESPATAANFGLVKGGSVPGSSGSAAVSSGCVGEILTAAVNSVTNISNGTFNTTNQLVLSAGIWVVAYFDGVYRHSFSGVSGQYQQLNGLIWNETDNIAIAESGEFTYTHLNDGADREMSYNSQFHISFPVTISASKTLRGRLVGSGGGGSFATRGKGKFYAVRIA